MIRIDENSVTELVGKKKDFKVTKVGDVMLLHTTWFALAVPPELLTVGICGEPEARIHEWPEYVRSRETDAGYKKGMPMYMRNGETSVVKLVVDGKPNGYVMGSVFDWMQTHLDDPEFFSKAIDSDIFVKENGRVVACLGHVKLT